MFLISMAYVGAGKYGIGIGTGLAGPVLARELSFLKVKQNSIFKEASS